MSNQASEAMADAPESTPDAALGDAGKRALAALRSEVKELKAKLKAMEPNSEGARDAAPAEDSTSENTSDSVPGADNDASATPVDTSQPKAPQFAGPVHEGDSHNLTGMRRQLGNDDLRGMSPAAIEAARKAGQLRDLLSGRAWN
ncbi:hypothetical protein [Actinacidiphila sp. bgisy167]|uniref:hypothetical protein n=1 Tax=Actinacidiphila sp. bgisy167 TaxID=3413797 RepID=UPI003D7204CB